jgi:hypothetical protein
MTNNDSIEKFGLLASGSCGEWCVDLDESSDGSAWLLQLEGPGLYFSLIINDVNVVGEMLNYLHSVESAKPYLIGQLGEAPISLHWDNEEPHRCFLIVGPTDHSVVRFSLSSEDAAQLADALSQVQSEFPVPISE